MLSLSSSQSRHEVQKSSTSCVPHRHEGRQRVSHLRAAAHTHTSWPSARHTSIPSHTVPPRPVWRQAPARPPARFSASCAATALLASPTWGCSLVARWSCVHSIATRWKNAPSTTIVDRGGADRLDNLHNSRGLTQSHSWSHCVWSVTRMCVRGGRSRSRAASTQRPMGCAGASAT